MALRRIKAIGVPGVTPSEVRTSAPRFEMADPSKLFVDESYQRQLAERSVRLIRKIVATWDWSKFKPPVVVETADGLEVIDGQHTSIAAATHPGISLIPVMIVEAAELHDRAAAFIGHNRDRIAMTIMQMHHAAVIARDPEALRTQAVCDAVGLKILKYPPARGAFKPGETVALNAIESMIARRGEKLAKTVLQALAEGKMSPVSAGAIRAAEILLTWPEYRGKISAADLTTVILLLGREAEHDAKILAATQKIAFYEALARVWFKNRPSDGR